jgi:hypothetical protein
MGLIKCPDCEAQISDAAPSCPKCGRPMGSQTRTEVRRDLTAPRPSRLPRYLAIFVGLIVLASLFSKCFPEQLNEPVADNAFDAVWEVFNDCSLQCVRYTGSGEPYRDSVHDDFCRKLGTDLDFDKCYKKCKTDASFRQARNLWTCVMYCERRGYEGRLCSWM